MTQKLRLGTLGDQIFGTSRSAPSGDAVLQGGLSIPTPHQGGLSIPTPPQGGVTIPVPIFAAADDLPAPPHPHYGGDLMILHGGLSIPTP